MSLTEWVRTKDHRNSLRKKHSSWYVPLLHGQYSASQVALVVKNPPGNAGDLRDMGSITGSGRSPGEGNGNPLQYSCLVNPMDRGAWRATVHRVTQSQTWLKRLSTQYYIILLHWFHHEAEEVGWFEPASFQDRAHSSLIPSVSACLFVCVCVCISLCLSVLLLLSLPPSVFHKLRILLRRCTPTTLYSSYQRGEVWSCEELAWKCLWWKVNESVQLWSYRWKENLLLFFSLLFQEVSMWSTLDH